jgi:hypothetical protein
VESSGLPALLRLTTILDLFNWYQKNLCQRELYDPRGCRVVFSHTDFVHLIKMVNKFGKEPKNRRITLEQIQQGRIQFVRGRFDAQRAQELAWAAAIVESPTLIVTNWQPLGRANPGEAYIRNFGTESQPIFRVMICGFAGTRRIPVTIFPRERFAAREIERPLWPK